VALLLPALLGLAGATLIVLHAVGDVWSLVCGRPHWLSGVRSNVAGPPRAGVPSAGTTLVAMTPTSVLLRGEGVLGVGTPLDVREEIRRRALDHQLDDMQITRFVQLLVDDLRSDSLLGNATDAIEQLAIFGSYDDTPLIAALKSDDAQQRYLAADVLSSLPRDGPPPAALVQIMVDALRSDDVRWNALDAESYLSEHVREARALLIDAMGSDDAQQRSAAMRLMRQDYMADPPPAYAGVVDGVLAMLLYASCEDLRSSRGRYVAGRGFRFLVRFAASAEQMLVEGMMSADPRQRLLCAAVAGCASRMQLMEQATPILVEHLASNAIENDGLVAARALGGFGTAVVPLLEPMRRAARTLDEQQRQAIDYVIRRLTTNDSVTRLRRELPAARLSSVQADVLECDIESMRKPQF